jgi:hypothetical protein
MQPEDILICAGLMTHGMSVQPSMSRVNHVDSHWYSGLDFMNFWFCRWAETVVFCWLRGGSGPTSWLGVWFAVGWWIYFWLVNVGNLGWMKVFEHVWAPKWIPSCHANLLGGLGCVWCSVSFWHGFWIFVLKQQAVAVRRTHHSTEVAKELNELKFWKMLSSHI